MQDLEFTIEDGRLNMLQIRNGWTWQTGWKLVGPTSA